MIYSLNSYSKTSVSRTESPSKDNITLELKINQLSPALLYYCVSVATDSSHQSQSVNMLTSFQNIFSRQLCMEELDEGLKT